VGRDVLGEFEGRDVVGDVVGEVDGAVDGSFASRRPCMYSSDC
jgi:hypothetical protein